jgi:hypothetical protein
MWLRGGGRGGDFVLPIKIPSQNEFCYENFTADITPSTALFNQGNIYF